MKITSYDVHYYNIIYFSVLVIDESLTPIPHTKKRASFYKGSSDVKHMNF